MSGETVLPTEPPLLPPCSLVGPLEMAKWLCVILLINGHAIEKCGKLHKTSNSKVYSAASVSDGPKALKRNSSKSSLFSNMQK